MTPKEIKENIFLYECSIVENKAKIKKYKNRIQELKQMLKEDKK